MKKGKMWINGAIVLALSIILMWFVLKDNYASSIEVFLSANIFWLIIGFAVYLCYFLLETLLLKILINEHKKDYSFRSAFKLYLMTKFFNGITPFSSGGQPLQIIELKKEGVGYVEGTTVIIKHFIILQTSVVVLSLLSLFVNMIFKFAIPTGFLRAMVVFGFLANYVILAVVIFLSYKIKLCEKFCAFFINIGAKLKLIKNKEEKLQNVNNSCQQYHDSYKELMKDKKYFWKLVLLESSALLFTFSIQFFVFRALGCSDSTFIAILTLSILTFMVGSFVPIPGGTGGMEYAFANLNEFIIPTMFISPAIILWRLIQYYLPMIIGGIVYNYERTKRDIIKVMEEES